MRGAVEALPGGELDFRWAGEGAVFLRGGAQIEAGERLHAQQTEDEEHAEGREEESKKIEDSAQPLPALALRIVEDLFAH